MSSAAPRQTSPSSRTPTTLKGFDALSRLLASLKRQQTITLRRLESIEEGLRAGEVGICLPPRQGDSAGLSVAVKRIFKREEANGGQA